MNAHLMIMCTCTNVLYKPQIVLNGFIQTLDMKRIRMTEAQTQILMEKFKAKKHPRKEEKFHLAKSLNITVDKVENWFRRKRRKKVPQGMLNQSE